MTDQLHLPDTQPEAITAAEDADRAVYRERLRQYLKDPEFRNIEGFPLGADEAILALSDPPYYTACPNPFLPEVIDRWQAERAQLRASLGLPDDCQDNGPTSYHREPFSADVSEGKTGPIYGAHTYHTKVPHKAIMRYILHYTEPGDIILDGFCGTGMTGVAAQFCGDRKTVKSLGYRVGEDGVVYNDDEAVSRLGARKSILVDLSPAATFIAYNYNSPVDFVAFEAEASHLLRRFEEEFGWMYETTDVAGTEARINFTVWSDVFVCNYCQGEIVFWDEAVYDGNVKDTIACPHCRAGVTKATLQRATTIVLDESIGRPVSKARRKPVLIDYTANGQRKQKLPDDSDLELIDRIESERIPGWHPTRRIDDDIDLWYERDYRSLGIYSIDSFFTRRSLIMLSWFYDEIRSINGRLRGFMWFWLESVLMGFSLLNRYRRDVFSQVNQILSGTLYVGALQSEVSPWYALEGKISRLKALSAIREAIALVSTASAASLNLEDSSIDYIFVDPPFGSNIIYSDLSIIWESWLRLYTNPKSEAVVHRRKKRDAFTLDEYSHMMTACFSQMYRVLKPGRWMTVEFHNSKNSVWMSIQEALTQVGFVVADVRTLDKQMQTFKQVTAAGAVERDLIISAYKPNGGLEKRFELEGGSEEGVWDFVRTHLRQLPVYVSRGGQIEVIAERQRFLLFDRMVAFHVQRGVIVPMSAASFYAGLAQRFVQRDGMFFLPDQVLEYDSARLQASRVQQLALFVSDEKSTIQWLRQEIDPAIGGHPQTYQEIQPNFLRELHQAAHEAMPELSVLLEQNFLQDDAGRWYVPEPDRAGDLEKLRLRALLREFATYQEGRGRLRQFRTEAVRAGFADAWRRRDYAAILKVAERLPDSVLHEDPDLLMYYDNASLRS